MIKVDSRKIASYQHGIVYKTDVDIESKKELLFVEISGLLKECFRVDPETTLKAVEIFLIKEIEND